MQILLTVEQEAQLSKLALEEGKGTDELVQELLNRGLAEEAGFLTSIRLGQDAASRGEFIDSAEVWAEVERALHS